MLRRLLIILAAALLLFGLPQMLSMAADMTSETEATSWSAARRDASGLAPKPDAHPEAIIQVYGAKAWGWRGNFAVHSWIAFKKANDSSYERYEIVGWRARHGGNALVHQRGNPDNYWFGSSPALLAEVTGEAAAALIPRIEQAISDYPHKNEYRAWPGPNSNSFIAHIGRAVPELGLDLPPTAIGKDYLTNGRAVGRAVSGRGLQVSLLGFGGFSLSPVEGAELHFLGLTLGVDIDDLALKLPGFGRIEPF